MTDRAAFLKALALNEDDTQTRLAYADWLDDRGEHEEADRQRRWPAAKEWLVLFCEKNNFDEYEDEEVESPISFERLIELGRECIGRWEEGGRQGAPIFSCGANYTMWAALGSHHDEFWEKWSIVTGIPLPAASVPTYFHCAC